FDDRQLPYVVAVNCFDGLLHHRIEDIRDALTIDQSVPIITVDARNRQSTKQALINLVEHAMRQWMSVRAG
ncbi:ATP-binding protein, partial [Solihabitans fulvus]